MRKLTVLFLTFLMTGFAFGTDYYISTQADFDTYRDAVFFPGDRILLERGGVFTGMLAPRGNGTPGNVITISAYGTGDMPVIHNNGVFHPHPLRPGVSADEICACILLFNPAYWEVNNIECTNNNSSSGSSNSYDMRGIYVLAEDTVEPYDHVYIEDCYIHHINVEAGGGVGDIHNADKGRGGIHVRGKDTGSGNAGWFNDLRIVNNRIEYIGGVGIGTNGDNIVDAHTFFGDSRPGAWTNLYIAGNFIGYTGRNNMIIRDCDYAMVEYNTFAYSSRDSTGHSSYCYRTLGITFQYNEAYGNTGSSTDKDRGGFDADNMSKDTLIQYNYSHSNEWFCGIMKDEHMNVTIRYNLSVNDRRGVYFYGNEPQDDAYNIKIYNNTHYFNSSITPKIMASADVERTPVNTTFNNNIFYCEGSGTMGAEAENGTNNVYNNNVYYNIPPPTVEINPITTDPLFVSPCDEPYNVDMKNGRDVLDGYKLSLESPDIDAGLLISNNGGQDFWGEPVPNGSTDIGANENDFQCDASMVHNITQGTYYCTIQAAIDAAVTGDVIEVEQGTYYEVINFNGTDITLTSTDPENWYVVENTVINASLFVPPTHAVEFSGSETSNCLLAGFTITGGTSSGVRGNGTLAAITHCIIEGNQTDTNGGGLFDCDGDILNCIVRNNNAGSSGSGGGLSECDGSIVNCLVYENEANSGGGLNDCDGLIVNCTIVNNTAEGLYACSNGASCNTFNCIVWGNTGSQWSGGVIPNYSCIENWTTGGVGNINTNPDFINPADNFRLQSGSLCIDAGSNSEIPVGITGDLNEKIRIFQCVVDMGAYEAQNGFANPDGDVDCDDDVDMGDFSVISQAWQSTQGQANYNIVCDLYVDNTIDISDLAVVAGHWMSVPSAPTVVNTTATNISFYSARLNGEVTDNGGQDPTVTVYWGDNNGGVTPGNWDHADTIGAQNSTFIDTIGSLSQGTMYYFRAYAENSAGGDWTDFTALFVTETLTAPAVTVSSATDITNTTATLNGEVTDTGGEIPSVTLYYGDDDAGEVAGSWDHSVSMGIQSSTFSTDIINLTAGTTYYYRAFANNPTGSDWSDVTSFATTNTIEITLDAVSSKDGNTGTLSWSHDLGSGSGNDRVVVVSVGTEGGDAFTGATFDDVAMTLASGSTQEQGNNITAIFYMLDADLPTEAGTYTVAVTMQSGSNIGAGAFSLENVRQDQPEVVTGTTVGGGTYISQSITTLTNGCWIIDVAGSGNSTSFVPDSPQVLRYWYTPGTSTVAGSTRIVPTAGMVVNGWTSGSDRRMCLSMAAFAPVGTAIDPIPPTVVNASATNITYNSARLNGQVTNNGFEDPTVTVYWGESDGGETPGNWDYAETLGTQHSTFFSDISSLSVSTTYHFRAYAENSAGGDWADSTASFTTTPAPSAPTVVNAAATNITFNSARLNGEVTDNGYEDPTVTVYWGESDGVETPGNWDNADVIGTQNSTFIDDISSLSESTTYYFRTYASNSAGSDWADSTASFDTTAVPDMIKINFQAGPLNSKDHPETVTPAGYLGDIGQVYGDRGDGYTYGWDQDIQADARGDGSWPEVRYDTLLHFAKGTPRTWEIALVNGTYTIDLFCGDDAATNQTNSVNVEGVAFTDPDGQADTLDGGDFDEWLEVPVTVSDGKLTITAMEPPADNAKILFIHITAE